MEPFKILPNHSAGSLFVQTKKPHFPYNEARAVNFSVFFQKQTGTAHHIIVMINDTLWECKVFFKKRTYCFVTVGLQDKLPFVLMQ
jgi:hypothetical protein